MKINQWKHIDCWSLLATLIHKWFRLHFALPKIRIKQNNCFNINLKKYSGYERENQAHHTMLFFSCIIELLVCFLEFFLCCSPFVCLFPKYLFDFSVKISHLQWFFSHLIGQLTLKLIPVLLGLHSAKWTKFGFGLYWAVPQHSSI